MTNMVTRERLNTHNEFPYLFVTSSSLVTILLKLPDSAKVSGSSVPNLFFAFSSAASANDENAYTAKGDKFDTRC